MITPELRQYLADFADGELDPALRGRIADGLADDPAAAAEVERWRSLRQAAGRAVLGEPVPAELFLRVRARLGAPRLSRPRFLRFGLSGLGVAAAVMLAFFVWPAGAEQPAIRACDFAKVYRHCALSNPPHNTFGIQTAAPNEPATLAAIAAESGMHVALPDLSLVGWRLAGACRCAPGNCDLAVVHVCYHDPALPGRIVSTFTIAGRIKLCTSAGIVGETRGARGCYHATRDGNVGVLCWDDGKNSYVLAGTLSDSALVELVDGLRAAQGVPAADALAASAVP